MHSYTFSVLRPALIAVFFCILFFIVLFPHITHGAEAATTKFVPLENFTNSTKLSLLYSETDPDKSLGAYINKLFFYAVSLGALLAVLRLAWAGYLYMSTDMFGKKEHAKEVISDTALGLLLLLSVYLILNQINPNILSLKVNMTPLPAQLTNTTTTYVDTAKNYTVTNVPTLAYPPGANTKAVQDARDAFAKECASNALPSEIKTTVGMDQCVIKYPTAAFGTQPAPASQIPTQADCKTNTFGFTRCTRDNFNFPAFGETNPICGTLSKNGDFICGFSDVNQCKATFIDVGFSLDGCAPLKG